MAKRICNGLLYATALALWEDFKNSLVQSAVVLVQGVLFPHFNFTLPFLVKRGQSGPTVWKVSVVQ